MTGPAGAARTVRVGRGASAPLGATLAPGGVNFSVFSKHATRVDLLLFDDVGAAAPARTFALEPSTHRTHHYWHVFVPGLRLGQVYGFHVRGPNAPARGLRFDSEKVLLDPYGLAVGVPARYDRIAASRPGSNTPVAMKSVVADPSGYDWEGDRPLRRPWVETIVYEMHVRGFTQHPSSGVSEATRGTYAGVIEKIPYLRDLGITAVELLPVFQFDPQDAPAGRTNYWGYQPISFFAPHQQYSSRPGALAAIDEFRDMVKALHRAGIEVILDVVFNHTTEGGADGPMLAYRGFGNNAYYVLSEDRSRYLDYTGCGNTLNAHHPVVRRLIQDSLRYWVREMHVDGFRFDLASVLTRDQSGQPLPDPAIIWDIDSDPQLAGTKLIAEAWDAGGLYQVGRFAGDAWQEWNGRFRDDLRRFLKSDAGAVPGIAQRLLGSPDIYAHKAREAEHSINFVTCHDGFTLNDLVSYDRKHNDANGEENRDGANDNLSWNCGWEGPTADAGVEALRNRQVKNALALTLLAAGTPMLLMGDEVRRTQHGNNNAYCQDGEISWFDWTLLARHGDIHRFVRSLIAFRLQRDVLAEDEGLTLNQLLDRADVTWHGVAIGQPDWSHDSRAIAFTFDTLRGHFRLHAMLNAYWEPLTFELPAVPDGSRWRRCLDTSLAPPDDVAPWAAGPPLDGTYAVGARTIALVALALTVPHRTRARADAPAR